jgi:hypothetical protein
MDEQDVNNVIQSPERVYFQSADFLVTSKIIRSRDRIFNPSMINSISFTQIVNPRYTELSNRVTVFSILAAFFGGIALSIIVYSLHEGFSDIGVISASLLTLVTILFTRTAIRAAQDKSNLEPYGWIGFDTSSGNTIELIRTNLIEAEKIRDALVSMIRDKNP